MTINIQILNNNIKKVKVTKQPTLVVLEFWFAYEPISLPGKSQYFYLNNKI